MRIAVLSDIHSNLQALNAVVEDLKRIKPDKILCAGDIVGYGANPNECCATVEELADIAVFGNHEVSALTGDTIWMNPSAAKAAKWTGTALSQAARDYLDQLELSARTIESDRRIAMYHGSIDSATRYVHEEELEAGVLDEAEADILILGHTHVPYVVRFERGLAINPGSVGQPRDMDPRASYAILDPGNITCEIRRLEYDVEGARKAIADAGLPQFLADRLLMGR